MSFEDLIFGYVEGIGKEARRPCSELALTLMFFLCQ